MGINEQVTVNAADSKLHVPKVRIARSILGLSTAIIYPLFRQSPLFEHGGARELSEFRSCWIAWLNETPRSGFLSYLDAYHQFLHDFRSGHWNPAKSGSAPPRRAALNALQAHYNRRSPH